VHIVLAFICLLVKHTNNDIKKKLFRQQKIMICKKIGLKNIDISQKI